MSKPLPSSCKKTLYEYLLTVVFAVGMSDRSNVSATPIFILVGHATPRLVPTRRLAYVREYSVFRMCTESAANMMQTWSRLCGQIQWLMCLSSGTTSRDCLNLELLSLLPTYSKTFVTQIHCFQFTASMTVKYIRLSNTDEF